MHKDPHSHLIPKICVSGAAQTSHCGAHAMEAAKELGKEIVKQGAQIVTGATTGFPLWSAIGAKQADGNSIGFSPAASEREHVEVYRLPIDYMDLIIYTGFGFAGRDLILTRSSDAVVFGCGRIGTVHEFTVAFEDNKPIGILEGAWEMDETLRTIIERSNRRADKVIFDDDPKRLISRVLNMIKQDKGQNEMTYSYRPRGEA